MGDITEMNTYPMISVFFILVFLIFIIYIYLKIDNKINKYNYEVYMDFRGLFYGSSTDDYYSDYITPYVSGVSKSIDTNMDNLEENLIDISNSLANVEIQVIDTNVNKINAYEQELQNTTDDFEEYQALVDRTTYLQANNESIMNDITNTYKTKITNYINGLKRSLLIIQEQIETSRISLPLHSMVDPLKKLYSTIYSKLFQTPSNTAFIDKYYEGDFDSEGVLKPSEINVNKIDNSIDNSVSDPIFANFAMR